MIRLSSVFAIALLSIHAVTGRAQSPIDFNSIAMPSVPASNGRVMTGQLYGSPDLELIVPSGSSLSVVDLFSGPLPTTVNFPSMLNIVSVAIADLDADGAQDLAAYGQNYVRVARQASIGAVTEAYSLSTTNPIHAADMDGDGDVDLLVGGNLFVNNGTGTALQMTTFAIGAASSIDVAPGDVDSDGDLDKIATFIGNSPAGMGLVSRIHRHNADHSFTLFGGQLLVAGATSARTAISDMNGDGKSDLVFVAADGASSFDAGLHTWIGQWLGQTASSTGFTATAAVESATTTSVPDAPAIADFDGDGLSDVVVPTSTSFDGQAHAVVSVYMTTPGGALTPATGRALADANTSAVSGPLGVAVVNADQDGRPDLFVASSFGPITLFHNDSATAQPVSMTILEAIGQNYAWASGTDTLNFGLADAADGSVLFGTPLTLTVFLPAGGTLTSTHPMGRRTSFVLPNPIPGQPVSISLSAPGGWSKSFTVQPSVHFTATTGGGQTAALGQAFPNPVTTRFVTNQGQPLAGVAVGYSGSISTPNAPVVYTDTNGYATFNVTAGPGIGGQQQVLRAFDGAYSEPFMLTTLGDTIQMDTPLQMTSCLGQTITISGHLFDAVGAPRAGVVMSLSPSSMSFPSTSATTAADGSFSFVGTTPILSLATFGISSPTAPQAPVSGTVTVSPVTITIDSGADQVACIGYPLQPITGHLSSPCGDGLAGRTVFITATGAPTLSFPVSSIVTTAQGTFSFQPTFATPPTVMVVAAIHINTTTQTSFASTTLMHSNGSLAVASGDLQVTNAGAPFAQPLVVSSTGPCAFAAGTPVTFSTTTPGVTLSPATTVIDANGNASTTVSTTTAGGGNITVHAVAGVTDTTFHLFARRLFAINAPTLLLISYSHEHPGVPLVFAADAPQTPTLTTPWGTICTSILAPGPSFGVLDGMGIFGSIDPGMVTAANGAWTRTFPLSAPLGFTFTGQMYGYDLNATFPFDYIVSNPVTFSF